MKVMYTTNTSMSYNALLIAAELGIKRVVMASSVNAIGMGTTSLPCRAEADRSSLLETANSALRPARRETSVLSRRRLLPQQIVSIAHPALLQANRRIPVLWNFNQTPSHARIPKCE